MARLKTEGKRRETERMCETETEKEAVAVQNRQENRQIVTEADRKRYKEIENQEEWRRQRQRDWFVEGQKD